jgi:hypothetical protein
VVRHLVRKLQLPLLVVVKKNEVFQHIKVNGPHYGSLTEKKKIVWTRRFSSSRYPRIARDALAEIY